MQAPYLLYVDDIALFDDDPGPVTMRSLLAGAVAAPVLVLNGDGRRCPEGDVRGGSTRLLRRLRLLAMLGELGLAAGSNALR